MRYTSEALALFNSPQHLYSKGKTYDIVKGSGDLAMGEYVNLYIHTEVNKESYIDSPIIDVAFSAIGGVMLIAAAEKFCLMIEGKSFREALLKCDELRELKTPGREYAVDFVIEAFYKSLETLSNS